MVEHNEQNENLRVLKRKLTETKRVIKIKLKQKSLFLLE